MPPEPPPFVKQNIKGRKKKPGRKRGHKGTSRPKPDHFDKIQDLTEDECTNCGEKLSDKNDIRTWEHFQEDFIPARRVVTKFVHHDRRCPKCKAEVKSPLGDGEIPHTRLGPRILIYSVLLHYFYRMPFRKAAEILFESCAIKVSAGALSGMAKRLAKHLGAEFEELLRAVRASPVVNVDETGWRVSGDNRWLWVFADSLSTVFIINKSRGGKVIDAVLGEKYDGVITSDFYSAYNKHNANKAKCWAHLLREFKKCYEKNFSDEFERMYRRVKRLWTDARKLWGKRGEFETEVYSRRVLKLDSRLGEISAAPYEDADAKRLAGRLAKHKDALFTFLRVEGVDPTNNKAERELRPGVVIRKISGGSRSDEGAKTFEKLMSLISTCRSRGHSFMDYATRALRHHLTDQAGTIMASLSPARLSKS